MCFLPPYFGKCPECSFQVYFIGYNIRCALRDYFPERKNSWHFWICNSAYNLLQCCNNMRSDNYGIDILLWLSRVTAFANNLNVYFVRRRHVFPRSEAYLSSFNQGHHMLTNHSLGYRIFKNTFVDHQTGSTWEFFFCRLKNKLYGASEFFFQIRQNLSSP